MSWTIDSADEGSLQRQPANKHQPDRHLGYMYMGPTGKHHSTLRLVPSMFRYEDSREPSW